MTERNTRRPTENRTRVLVFAHSPGLAGAEKSLLETLRLLCDQYQIALVAPGKGAFLDAAEELGVSEVQVVPQHLYYERPGYSRLKKGAKAVVNLSAAFRSVQIAARFRPHLIYSNSVAGWTGALVARARRIPHVWHLRELLLEDSLGRPVFGQSLERTLLRDSATVFLCNSHYVREWYRQRFGIAPTVAYQPVSVPDEEPAMAGGAQVVLSVFGRLQPQKRQHIVLEALARLPAHLRARCTVRVYGADSVAYRAKLESIAFESGLQANVEFKGYTDRPAKAILASDVVVAPAVDEAFGRVCAEAMLLRVPVLGAAAGGTLELLGADGVRGSLFPADDAQALSNLIEAFLQSRAPFSARAELARRWAVSVLSEESYTRTLQQAFTSAMH